MDRHQAGQEEKLVHVRVDRLEVLRTPRGSAAGTRTCFKCVSALAAVMGLINVALVVGFLLYFFTLTSSCNQVAPLQPTPNTTKVNITCRLTESDEQGRYDLFTVAKSGTYLIHGWMNLTHVNKKAVLVLTKDKKDRVIQRNEDKKTIISFLEQAKLASGIRMSVRLESKSNSLTNSLFHVYEL